MSAPVVVLGAGCAGLAAARRLAKAGRRVLVLEREGRVGGLAGGIVFGGSLYEYGPHVFHTTDPEILADVKEIMGPDLLPFERTIKIKFLGNYFQFPLSAAEVLFKLPPTTVLRAGLSLALRLVQGALIRPEVETSETVLRRYYGDVLYKLFFRDYIERVWGIPPAQFSPAFARERIPRFNLLEVVDKAKALLAGRLGVKIATAGYVEKVAGDLYTTREGFSLITRRMAERVVKEGGEIRLNAEVVKLERNGSRITNVHTSRDSVECSAVLNTLPINDAVMMMSPTLGLETAARKLRFRATVFVGLKVRRAKVLPASFMYFREYSFNRVTDLAHFSHKIDPPGTTLLVAEVNCDPGDRYWEDDAHVVEAVLADLEREGILSRAEVLETHTFRSRHAYPMYTLGYEEALAVVLGGFCGLSNAESAGRQGRFQYVNTHVAMKMGYEAADRLLAKVSA